MGSQLSRERLLELRGPLPLPHRFGSEQSTRRGALSLNSGIGQNMATYRMWSEVLNVSLSFLGSPSPDHCGEEMK